MAVQLYPHQVKALQETERFNKVGYFLDMGLGKTFVGSEKAKELKKPLLLVCQKSKIEDWVTHLVDICGFDAYDLTNKKELDYFLQVMDGDKEVASMTSGIINYELSFRRPDLLKLKDFTLMLDESSLITNPSAKRTKFIDKLNPSNVILLSGTPTGGKYEKLWSQLHLLGWNISKDLFYKQYVVEEWIEDGDSGFKMRVIVGYKNVDRLKAKLKQYGCIFMKTEEVFDLPEQVVIPVMVTNTKEFRYFMRNSVVTIEDKKLIGDIKDNAKDALEELVDYQKDMIKQDIENQKDAIDKKLDYLKEFYDKQKEMLQDQYDEEEYLKEQSEKRKSVSDIQAQLAQLEFDDSAWAQKRKAELQKDLADAQGELDDFEKQHALDLALDALEDSYNAQEEQLQKQIDALDAELNNPELMFNKALLAIQENTGNLYQQMLEYNRKYGTGNDDDVKDIYEEAYKALLEYKELYGKDYEGVKLTNATGYKPNTGWDTSTVSGTNPSNQNQKPSSNSSSSKPSTSQSNAPSLSKGSSITVKKTATHFSSKSRGVRMASFVPGGTYTVYQTSGNEVLIGRNGVYTGWINKSDIVGYATGTKKATAGLHSIDELGTETTFESKDGVRYKLFTGGEKVLNAKASDFLYEFANGGGEILKKIIRSALGGGLFDTIQPVIRQNEINMGDIIVRGNADQQTVSAIRREQRSAVETMLKEFNKLNK